MPYVRLLRRYPTRQEVERANTTRLAEIRQQPYTYSAHDFPALGDDGQPVIPLAIMHTLLNRLVVPPQVTLKVGAQVMLLKARRSAIVRARVC